jgi:hypothetical protein
MPVTISVNMLSVSHKGSIGISTAFPDVCKTPTPAGPVPIPYPNIAMSADTFQGSKTVKMDGNEIMTKGANMKMSTGDEPGAALGVVSNKIKGKAEFVNYSFDVKVDGKNVCRLSDPTQQNMGSANTAAAFHVQAPVLSTSRQLEGCEATDKKQKEKKVDEKTAWNDSGVFEGHRAAIQAVVDDNAIIIFIRATNKACAEKGWIPGKHKPKPHEVLEAKTISDDNVQKVRGWLQGPHNRRNWKGPPALPRDEQTLLGVVMSLRSDNRGEPLKGYGMDSNKYSYKGKWITGDYDLQDIMFVGGTCLRLDQDAEWQFGRVKTELNKRMGWDGIQHGPQAQWIETVDGVDVNMPRALDEWLKAPANTPVRQIQITPQRKLAVCDKKLTVVAPQGTVLALDTAEDGKNALICAGCGEK